MNPSETKGVRKNKSEEPEMEIELTLDSGLVCDFAPDFRLQKNTADHSAVSWGLSGGRTAGDVVILCNELQDEESLYPTFFSGTDMRLLPWWDEGNPFSQEY